MITVSDIAFPDTARDVFEVVRLAGKKLLVNVITGGDCPNCGGLRYVFVDVVTSGPRPDPFHMGGVSLLVDASWYTGERHQFPCPMCNGDQSELIAILWERSGLELNEREWHIGYIEDMAGKDVALQTAGAWLAQTPRPVGWLLLYGGYGVGKSGLLKALVAGFVRAGVSARYIRAFDILEEIKATFDGNARESTSASWARFTGYRFFAIDEADITPSTDWSYKAYRNLLDHRYDSRFRCATAFAMNATPGEMQERLGYLDSRLRDGERIPIGGVDLRGVQALGDGDSVPWE